jgi:O-antigen ligase
MIENSMPAYDFQVVESNSLMDTRTSRWQYALELWQTKYNFCHKILGHGFDYLYWYGTKYYPETKRDDWPHNPFITILLYSGIVGLMLYIVFLLKVVSLYYNHINKYSNVFICFIITFFFSFFSAGNPFDPPVMGFFVMLPFLIDYVHKKDISN